MSTDHVDLVNQEYYMNDVFDAPFRTIHREWDSRSDMFSSIFGVMPLTETVIKLPANCKTEPSFQLPLLSGRAYDVLTLAIPDIAGLRNYRFTNLNDSAELTTEEKDEEDTLWETIGNMPYSEKESIYSWESFGGRVVGEKEAKELRNMGIFSPYLTEVGISAFEGIYQKHFRHQFAAPESLIKQNTVFEAVVKLLVGMTSNLFRFNPDRRRFEPILPNIRIMGWSSPAMEHIFERFLSYGTHLKRLEHVVERCQDSSVNYGLTGIAFGYSLATYLLSIEKSVLNFVRALGTGQVGLIKLYHSVGDIAWILEKLAELCCCDITEYRLAKLSASQKAQQHREFFYLPSGGNLLTLLYKTALSVDTAPAAPATLYKSLIMTLLAQSSVPYFNMLNRWIGVNMGLENGILDAVGEVDVMDPYDEFFLTNIDGEEGWVRKDGDAYWTDYYQMVEDKPPPSFIPYELARVVLESGKSLRLLRDFRPEHPLCVAGLGVSSFGSEEVGLRWVMTKREIDELQKKVEDYVAKISNEIARSQKTADHRRHKHALKDVELLGKDEALPYSSHKTLARIERGLTKRELLLIMRPFDVDIDQQYSHGDIGINSDTTDSEDTNFSDLFSIPSISSQSSSELETLSVAARGRRDIAALISMMEHLLAAETDPASKNELDDTSLEGNYVPPLPIITDLTIRHSLRVFNGLINASVLSLFFNELDLQSHFHVLRRFMLLGDGIFINKLTEALFTDEIETGEQLEGNKRHAGVGLQIKLSSRQKWPPRGAELSMALKTVLLESITEARESGYVNEDERNNDVEGLGDMLSFAVRDTDNDFEICTDPQAVEALDFLYLSYRPPYPVNVLIGPSSLIKYNRLFSFLLRIMRVDAVVRRLYRLIHQRSSTTVTPEAHEGDSLIRKFRFEANQFVTALYGYVTDVAIGSTWVLFMKKLKQMARRAVFAPTEDNRNKENDKELESAEDLDAKDENVDDDEDDEDNEDDEVSMDLETLRAYHDHVLDRMLFQSLLKKKQEPIMKVVNGIFIVIIAFARQLDDHRRLSLRRRPTFVEEQDHCKRIEAIYDKFRLYIQMLLKILVKLEEKGGGRMGMGLRQQADREAWKTWHDENDIKSGVGGFLNELLLRLDFNGFYRSQVVDEEGSIR